AECTVREESGHLTLGMVFMVAYRVRLNALVAAVFSAATFVFSPAVARAQKLADWEKFDFAHKRVDSAAVEKMSLSELRSLRGIVFGKHGRPFADEKDVQTYLKSRPWYKADTMFKNTRLSAMEKANIDVIRLAEAHKHAHIETGD